MLTYAEKRIIERETLMIIHFYPRGINTRVLISQVMKRISSTIPNANRHHVAGMLSWIWKNNRYQFLVRTPGYSIIA